MRRTVVLALALIAGCKWGPEYKLPPPSTDRLPTASDAVHYAAVNSFAFDLAAALEMGSGNAVVSPLSVAHNLALVMNGSSGTTHDQLMGLFSVTEDNRTEFNESQRALLNRLYAINGEPLVVSSAVFTVWPIVLDEAYVRRAGADYDAVVKRLGGAGIEAKRLLDQWVTERTDGRITSIVDDLTKQEQLLLVNVAHFTARWQSPFDSAWRGTFHSPGGEVQADLMSVSGRFRYLSSERFQAVELPYRAGFSFLAILPSDGLGVSEVLDSASWSSVVAGLSAREGRVLLPRFSFGGEFDLKRAVEALGAPSLFGEDCNLRIMSIELERGYRFSRMVHKAVVAVDEEGTTASAATLSVAEGSEAPPGSFSFRADRPFAFAIVESETGAICFLGVVTDPSRSQ